MEEKPQRKGNAYSKFPKVVLLRIANFASASTLSNLYAAFFSPPVMDYDGRMLKHIQSFCDDYQARKQINTSDLERFNQVDNYLIEDLCCLFDYLKNKLMQSKDVLIKQYYQSGRRNSEEICKPFSYFNTITEALIRFLWLHILLGDFSFRDMQKYKYSGLVLYSDDYFLKSEKSRERTKHLNCTFQNLFIEYVTLYLEYATYLGFTRMIYDLDLKIKLECFQFHFPDSLAQIYNNKLDRFTMVNNINTSLRNHWHFTTDIFFGLTVDNNKFTKDKEYCAYDGNSDGENCRDAAESILGCSIGKFVSNIDDHSRHIYTNTCAGNVLSLNEYGNYLLDIKGYDEDAQSHYIRFCDEYLQRQNRPNELAHEDLSMPISNSTSLIP